MLIAISVLVALFSGLGESREVLQPLLISDPFNQGFESILQGQVWRLITPIFIHFGLMHLLFNMMAMWDLGRLIDVKKSAGFYITFVLVVGIASNLAQYLLTQSPYFGGMSGVLFGLFGYVWMQGRFNPAFGFSLHKNTVIFMLGWFVLCWTGLLGPIANWAHTAGLVVGAAWGYLSSKA